MSNLESRVALVTGASRGIGRACAYQLAQAGADVAINYLSNRDAAVSLAESIQKLGRRAVVIRADVSRQEDVQAMVESAIDRLGGLNILVSNAAAGGFRPAMELSPVNTEAIFRTNAMPLVWLVQAAMPQLANPQLLGKVIAISSHGSMRAVPNYAAIGASKAALESLVRHFALELGPQGINFNCVLAGMVATDAVRTMPDSEAILRAAQERMLVPDRRLEPADIAGIVSFLAGPSSDLIQGQTLVVDGGVSVRV